MNSRQLEQWVFRIVEDVITGNPNEDFRVELKREWIPKDEAARKLAAHANSARGEHILWLIGVDQKSHSVINTNHQDLANWYPGVCSQFDAQIAPDLSIDLNIPVEDKTIVALLFNTNRAPYVVKVPEGRTVHREIPWREGTSTRTATRSDLLKILTPLELLPNVEVVNSNIRLTKAGKDGLGNPTFDGLHINLELYISPKNSNRIVIPFHKCVAWVEVSGVNKRSSCSYFEVTLGARRRYRVDDVQSPSETMVRTRSEVLVDGPGMLNFYAIAEKPLIKDHSKQHLVHITVHLSPVNSICPIVITETLPYPIENNSSNDKD